MSFCYFLLLLLHLLRGLSKPRDGIVHLSLERNHHNRTRALEVSRILLLLLLQLLLKGLRVRITTFETLLFRTQALIRVLEWLVLWHIHLWLHWAVHLLLVRIHVHSIHTLLVRWHVGKSEV
jgi:hypothetical protein